MTGCIFKRKLKSGITWGYSFFAGRDEHGRRIQVFKSGFATKGAADDACKAAITMYETEHRKVMRDTGRRGRREWAFILGDVRESGFASRDAAEAALKAAIEKHEADAARRAQQARSDDALTFARYFARWIDEHAARRLAPKTCERYRELGVHLIRHLGETPLNELSTAQIQRVVHELEDHGGAKTEAHPGGRPLAPKTVRHIGTLLYTALAEADRLGYLKIPHPMANKRVLLPKLSKRRPAVIDKDKLRDLLTRAQGTRLYPFIVLAAATGCRRGELLALN